MSPEFSPTSLSAPAIDEALADATTLADSTLRWAGRGSRREAAGPIDRVVIDRPHVAGAADAASDGLLLRQLAQQLSALQAQQDQIRRLLEQAEQSSRTPAR